jgi:hypothetical protein
MNLVPVRHARTRHDTRLHDGFAHKIHSTEMQSQGRWSSRKIFREIDAKLVALAPSHRRGGHSNDGYDEVPQFTKESHYAFLVNEWFLPSVEPSSRFRKGNQ